MAVKGNNGSLRIIGGEWRSRRLSFPDVEGLRPTPDRVRETLFNWLQGRVEGARCLDLYAGSGALGLEALSRGAAEVVFVDSAPKVARQLEENLALLNSRDGRVVRSDVLNYLRGGGRPFDIVFLDPPFRHDLLEPSLRLLDQRGWLAPRARIYLESESDAENPPALPDGWQELKHRVAGQVKYQLIETA
ncbi:16S rRNA (guanine(966)-N(2))-methyltransferase RsmD [Thiohalomonas denitrificans]|uniref:Ribosomal RNA small subunit methyltransferase D n=1 Tax=Thiohalomonas denitrificans TaxID=415747 RepID=A0A1G5PW55_9GAMM|nr:16S rRNA (guanine(966)-N(2))-methyltransferase RsmD [Thiohalomonas denitrificans]SCZ53279.1 16S rRNA (guanine966-N2)-methyltransferase [Thiohalomonas denitrificans]